MQTDICNQPPVGRSYRWVRFTYPLLFLLLLTLANLPNTWLVASELAQTLPGTIPPGGTLPEPPTPVPGAGLVRVLHLAPFDTNLANTAVDICTEAGAPVVGLTDLVYLEQSGYSTLTPGVYDWTVSTPGCTTVVLDLPAFTLKAGSVLTLLIVGGGNQPLNSVLLVDREAGAFAVNLPIIYR